MQARTFQVMRLEQRKMLCFLLGPIFSPPTKAVTRLYERDTDKILVIFFLKKLTFKRSALC